MPYGIYDTSANSGYVSLGIDHDTAQFAVNATRLWLDRMGRERYPDARKVVVTADCGGSNGPRLRPWKVELQRLADATGLTFRVCHYPPGTSKWNKVEHRLFCHITQSWRATPLTSRLAVVELIASTTTKTGLTVRCELDTNSYPKGIKVTDAEMATLELALSEEARPGGPPQGRKRWTLDLLTGAMVRRTEHRGRSRETVRRRLAEDDIKPCRRNMWCIPQVDGAYVACMEDGLDLYGEPADPKWPVVCFDENPDPVDR